MNAPLVAQIAVRVLGALIGIASIAVGVFALIVRARLLKGVFPAPALQPANLSRDVLDMMEREALADSNALVIFPDCSILLRNLAGLVSIWLLLAALFAWDVVTRQPGYLLAAAGGVIVLSMVGYVVVGLLSRLLQPRPAVVVAGAGIVDQASLWGTGDGLIRWDEIAGVFCYTRRHGQLLVVMPVDPAAIRARQPLHKRIPLALFRLGEPSPVMIPANLLSMPIDELVKRLPEYDPKLLASDDVPLAVRDPEIDVTSPG